MKFVIDLTLAERPERSIPEIAEALLAYLNLDQEDALLDVIRYDSVIPVVAESDTRLYI